MILHKLRGITTAMTNDSILILEVMNISNIGTENRIGEQKLKLTEGWEGVKWKRRNNQV